MPADLPIADVHFHVAHVQRVPRVALKIQAVPGQQLAFVGIVALRLMDDLALCPVLDLRVGVAANIDARRGQNRRARGAGTIRIARLARIAHLVIRVAPEILSFAALRVAVASRAALHHLRGTLAHRLPKFHRIPSSSF